jgi:hypothetical protein
MPQPTDDAHALHDVLVGLPLHDRLAALVCSIIEDDPRATSAVASIISVAAIMAKHLSPTERVAIVWHLLATAEEIEARWQ